MCDCKIQLHPEIDCGAEGCNCHPPQTDSEFVYLSVSFPRVGRETAKALVSNLTDAAGLIPYNVFFDDAFEDDDEEDENG